MKTCTKCKLTKELNLFAKQPKAKDGLQTLCKACQAENTRRWYAAHKEYSSKKRSERYKKNKKRDRELVKKFLAENRHKIKEYNLKKYGLTLESHAAMLAAQNHVCAICSKACKNYPTLVVDHDHSSNKVRGLLCNKCNRGLGMFEDNAESLQRAIEYLRK